MRVVVDTNILISAFITHRDSPPRVIYKLILHNRITLVSSIAILDEFEEVLSREAIVKLHQLTTAQVGEIVDSLAEASDIVPGDISIFAVAADPSDNKFIAAAIEGRADFIISGDRHLLDIKTYQGIPIISARQFVFEILDA